MPYLLGMSLALSLALSGQAQTVTATTTQLQVLPVAQAAPQKPHLPSVESVREYVAHYFAKEPIMVSIAECESHFHQYDADGSVYHGQINHDDLGVMQINEYYQGDTAKQLGFDLNTLQGNVAYAQYLYEKQGTQPWTSSSPCWEKTDAGKALASAQ